MQARYIKIDPSDNVATVVTENGAATGAEFADGLTALEPVPQAHKITLADIDKGDAIRRYGHTIGFAKQPLPAGSWVREEVVALPEAPELHQLDLSPNGLHVGDPLEGYEFEGYPNPDGTVGTKNILGITTTVQCVAATVEHAARRIREELLPRFPNVDEVVPLTHHYGCGVAINVPDAEIPIRSIENISRNPNFGAMPLVVSLGCEKMQPERLFPTEAIANGSSQLPPVLSNAPYVIRLQDESGFQAAVAAIMRFAEKRLEELNRRTRKTCPASSLIVGMQCGGSDALSGVTANPAVGFASDLLVRAGATVMFSEVTEVRDAVHLLTPRCVTREVGQKLVDEMLWYDEYLGRGHADRSANTSPGNKRGGLANIVEKSLGSVAKSGLSPISGVLTHGERASTKGLLFAATPAGDFICGTQQLAAGMNVHIFTTGRGTPYGLALAPVIKVSSQTSLSKRWHDLIDVDAGRIASGEATIEDVGWEIFRLILDVAGGRHQTFSDRWKLFNDMSPFNPGPLT